MRPMKHVPFFFADNRILTFPVATDTSACHIAANVNNKDTPHPNYKTINSEFLLFFYGKMTIFLTQRSFGAKNVSENECCESGTADG